MQASQTTLNQSLIERPDYSNNILDNLDRMEANFKAMGSSFPENIKSMFASEIRSAENIPSANSVKCELAAKWLAFGINAATAYIAYQKEDENNSDTITDGILATTAVSTGVEALSATYNALKGYSSSYINSFASKATMYLLSLIHI